MNDHRDGHECDVCPALRQVGEASLLFEEKVAELSTIREAGDCLRYISDFPRVCRNLLDLAMRSSNAETCSLMLLDRQKNLLYPVAARDRGDDGPAAFDEGVGVLRQAAPRLPEEESAAGRAVRERKSILAGMGAGQPVTHRAGPGTAEGPANLLAVPLVIEEDPLGVLLLGRAPGNAFGEKDLRFLDILSSFFALVVHASLESEKLRNSEEKYRALSENADDGIAIVQEGIHVYANRKYRRMTGYSLDELEAMTFHSLVKREAPPERTPGSRTVPPPRIRRESFEAALTAREGPETRVEVNRTPIRFEGKDAELITVRDLMGRKLLEEQIIQARKMKAVATLAGGIAHDFNNLLQAILGYGELLTREVANIGDSRWKLRQITDAARRGATLTRQLLTFSGRIEPHLHPMDFNLLVEQMKDLLSRVLPKSVSLVYDLERDLDIVNVDVAQMEQILFNLALNGKDAMPGGGSFIVHTRKAHVTEEDCLTFPALRPGPHVLLIVEDTGCGMDAETLQHIFEPFYTTKGHGKGTGLGMAMVYGIVKEHGGEIACRSSPGHGTTFTIYLPAVNGKGDAGGKTGE